MKLQYYCEMNIITASVFCDICIVQKPKAWTYETKEMSMYFCHTCEGNQSNLEKFIFTHRIYDGVEEL